MEITKIMTYHVVSVNPKTSIGEALDIMEKNKINGVPVVEEENKLKGMVVKSDIYRFLMDEGHNKEYPVELAMTKLVVTAEIEEDIFSIAKKLRQNEIIAMPVLDKNKVIGIISIEDIIDYFLKNAVK